MVPWQINRCLKLVWSIPSPLGNAAEYIDIIWPNYLAIFNLIGQAGLTSMNVLENSEQQHDQGAAPP